MYNVLDINIQNELYIDPTNLRYFKNIFRSNNVGIKLRTCCIRQREVLQINTVLPICILTLIWIVTVYCLEQYSFLTACFLNNISNIEKGEWKEFLLKATVYREHQQSKAQWVIGSVVSSGISLLVNRLTDRPLRISHLPSPARGVLNL